MPYYQWVGIDLLGNTIKGTTCSSSIEQLESTLLEQEIAVLKAKATNQSFKRNVHQQDICNLFKQLHVLLDSGVFLSRALETLVQMAHGHALEQLLTNINNRVRQGVPLSEALALFPDQFDMLTITMIKAGEEAGNMPTALNQVCNVLEARISFANKMRSATLTPIVTFSFFIAVLMFITVVIIPHFKHIFTQQAQLPWLTQCLISISDGVLQYGIYGLLMVVSGIVALRTTSIKNHIKPIVDNVLIYIPGINALIEQLAIVSLLQPLGLLLHKGVALPDALHVALGSVNNSFLKASYAQCIQEVEQGHSLSTALEQQEVARIPFDIITMVRVGEESGRLPIMIQRCADYYEEQVLKKLDVLLVIIQPTLMILIGLLVAMLIFAVYMPIIELSNVIAIV